MSPRSELARRRHAQRPTRLAVAGALVGLCCLLACGDGKGSGDGLTATDMDSVSLPADGVRLPWTAERLAPVQRIEDLQLRESRVWLGKLLFHDPLLSSDRETACVTCHSELWGLGDNLERGVGVLGQGPIGPGRDGPNLTRRNSQTLWNVGLRESLFWDGRSDTLEAQALEPLKDMAELGRPPEEVAADLDDIPEYLEYFEAAFPGEELHFTPEHMGLAIAEFQRGYVSDRSPYDLYLAGDSKALDEEMVEGMFLFAELGCADCHAPPRFESERYADRHVPAVTAIVDRGRAEVTERDGDLGRFRTPTLRNVRETGPYFHNGSVDSLEQAVAHEVLEQQRAGVARELERHEQDALLRFVHHALIDVSREQFRPHSVPSGLDVPADGDRLFR